MTAVRRVAGCAGGVRATRGRTGLVGAPGMPTVAAGVPTRAPGMPAVAAGAAVLTAGATRKQGSVT